MNRDTAFDLLSDPTRRAVVAVLREAGAVSRERLVERVAARVPGSTSPTRIRAELAAEHLPRLGDAGVVECDDASVTPTPALAAVAEHLPEAGEPRRPTGRPRPDGRPSAASETRGDLRERLVRFYA